MLIDGLGKATAANGLLRVETLVKGADGEDIRGADLLIPINRLEVLIASLQTVVEQLKNQIAPKDTEPTEIN